MGERWIAAALLALALVGTCAVPPLAEAAKDRGCGAAEAASGETVLGETASGEAVPGETAPGEAAPAEEAPEAGCVLAETAGPAGSLADMRAAAVTGVPEEHRDAACYAVYRGLLETGPEGAFGGEEPVSRGEAVAALYRLSGVQVRVDECGYGDVPEEYRDAVAWAGSAGVSGGMGEGRFAPASPVTRSQLAAMLYRFAAWRGEDMTCRTAVCAEGEEVPAYAREAMDWVFDRGLYEGMTDNGIYPDLPVSRLQLACILARLERERDPLAGELALPEGGTASRSRERHEAIAQAVAAAARRHGAVGVQVAVVEGGAVTDTYRYGWAVQGTVPMTDRHKIRVASLSKVAVGLCAALLQEEGAVDYDAGIGAYWGTALWKPVTIRSILTHTSTLLNSESIAWDYEGVKAQLGSKSGYGGGTPGSLGSWNYNNHAFGILGQTLELASGRYLDDVLSERVLDFVGADGAFAAGALEQPELIAPLYRTRSLGRSADSVRSVARWSAPGATGRQFAGGFTTSAKDMAKLAALLAGDGCFEGVRLMEAASVERMEGHSARALPDGTYQALPMRLRPGTYGREALYYHTGSAYGVYNLLSYDPSTGDGVVVLTTGADGGKDACGIYAVCGEISRAVYDAIA
ncbi:serine hydrolase [uncultured Oscillibacter sp.]|nr:serine hydrolase [uncultured Oscillibacter sp.]